MTDKNQKPVPAFLAGGGEMGALTRRFDWSSTSIGGFDQWPQSLCTIVGLLLHSRFPMFLWWGPELIQFYNDAYRPSLGNDGKHPLALGQKGADCWPEIWPVVKPLIDQVLGGGDATWHEDALIPIYRNGRLEDVYWTFSYSPVTNDDGEVNGVLVVCTETTEKVKNQRKIEETKDQFRFAIDASELATWEMNPLTLAFVSNERLKEWFGLDAVGQIELELALRSIAEKDRDRVLAAVKRALEYESGGVLEVEYSIINPKTNHQRTIKATGKALFNEDKEPYRFNGILHDITAEVSAREMRQKLLTLVDNSVDLMAILEPNGMNSYINKAGRDILGIDDDADVTKIPIAEFHTAEQLAFVEAEILPSVFEKGRWAGAFAIRNKKTAEIIPLYNNCHRIEDKYTGVPIGVGAVMRDLRPEIQARKVLAENEERLNIAIDTSELAMWEVDLVTDSVYYNNRYLEILGFDKDERPNHTQLLQHIHPEDLQKRNAAVQLAKETGLLDTELRIRHTDGTTRWLRAKGKVFYDDQHHPVKQLGTIMDVTEQKNMAQQLEEKVRERTIELQNANDELERKNKDLASFAYVSSHDLQEPLRKINTFISRIDADDIGKHPARQKEYLGKIKNAATRMQLLINDLLSFSRTSTAEKEFVRTDLNQLMDDVLKDLQETIQKTHTTVQVDNLETMDVIVFQFYQLFTNLLGNGIKFARKEESTRIHIHGEHMAGKQLPFPGAISQRMYYHISIADTGIGFEPQYSERIFEVFQRLHGKTEYEGTGIGLAICKKIVENHHGFISAEGKPGEGAVFHVYIPVSR
jgi:PAS domain S-box-containing protein